MLFQWFPRRPTLDLRFLTVSVLNQITKRKCGNCSGDMVPANLVLKRVWKTYKHKSICNYLGDTIELCASNADVFQWLACLTEALYVDTMKRKKNRCRWEADTTTKICPTCPHPHPIPLFYLFRPPLSLALTPRMICTFHLKKKLNIMKGKMLWHGDHQQQDRGLCFCVLSETQ